MNHYAMIENGETIGNISTDYSFHKGDHVGDYIVDRIKYIKKTREFEMYVNSIPTMIDDVQQLATDALYTDGGHHKQWYLEEILEAIGREPILDPEYSYEHGIPP